MADMRKKMSNARGGKPLKGGGQDAGVTGRAVEGRGFTLIELMVVVAIIILIVAISTPALNGMLKNNAQQQSVNMVNSMLASARASAMNRHKPVGVVFYEDAGSNNSTAAVLTQQMAGSSATPLVMTGLGADTTVYLPRGTRVAVLGDNGVTTDLTATHHTRMVLFDARGQLMTQTKMTLRTWAGQPYQVGDAVMNPTDFQTYTCLKVDFSGGVAQAQAQPAKATSYPALKLTDNNCYWALTPWNLNDPTDAGASVNSFSSPGVLIYDDSALQAAEKNFNLATVDQDRSAWLVKNGTLLVVNPITGNVVR